MKLRLLLLLLLWLGLAVRPVRAQDAPWYVGMPLAQVSLEAPDGGLEQENFTPLLLSLQGKSYNPADVRSDLRMLHSVGNFAAVEAHLEPWVEIDEQGDPIAAIWLIYRVWPAPVIRRIQVSGNRALNTPELLQTAGLRSDARFFSTGWALASASPPPSAPFS